MLRNDLNMMFFVVFILFSVQVKIQNNILYLFSLSLLFISLSLLFIFPDSTISLFFCLFNVGILENYLKGNFIIFLNLLSTLPFFLLSFLSSYFPISCLPFIFFSFSYLTSSLLFSLSLVICLLKISFFNTDRGHSMPDLWCCVLLILFAYIPRLCRLAHCPLIIVSRE